MAAAFAASGVQMAYYFDIHNGDANQYADGLFYSRNEPSYPDGGGVDSPTAIFYAFAMLSALGDQVVGCTLPAGVSQADVGCWATKRSSDGSVQAFVVNKTSTARSLELSGLGGKTAASRYSLQSAAVTPTFLDFDVLYNGVRNPPYTSPLPAPSMNTVSGASYQTPLPPYSAVLIDFH